MATVAQLITDIDERMPNRFSDATKIRWMNNFQKQIFRRLNLPGIFSFNTRKDVGAYQLPESCSIDLIQNVIYDGTSLEYKSLEQEVTGSFYYSVAGQIGIYPRPSEDNITVTVFYNRRPEELTEADKDTQVPEITEDYHELLVLHVLITIAKAREDAQLANAYTYDLNEMILNLRMDLIEREPEYTHTRDVIRGQTVVEEADW